MLLDFTSLLKNHSSCGSKIFGALGMVTLMKIAEKILKTLTHAPITLEFLLN